MDRPVVVLACGLFALFALSGCVESDQPPVPEDAIDIPVRVRLEALDGDTIPWSQRSISYQVHGREVVPAADGTHVQAVPGERFDVFVEGAPDFSSEEVRNLTSSTELAEAGIDVVVYRSNVVLEWTARLDPGVRPITSRWTGGPAWWVPGEVRIHPDDDVQREYVKRIGGLSVEMTWANSATDNADLGIGFGVAEDDVAFVWDENQDPNAGSNSERLFVLTQQIELAGIQNGTTVFAGPLTHEPVVAVDGIDVQMKVWFYVDQELRPAPGLPFAAVLFAALGAAALAAKRRGM